MKLTAIHFLIAILCSQVTWAQLKSFNPKQSLSDITISQWTTKEGLPSNNTSSVFQDSNGLIWITSFNGFMVYDGERIETYDKNRLPFLETDGFYAVAENYQGTLFLASNGNGVIKYEKGEFSRYRPMGEEIPKSIRSIYVSSDSSLYIGSFGHGLFKVKNDSAIKVTGQEFDKTMIRVIVEDQQNNIWFGTESNGLCQVKNNQVQNFNISHGLLSNNIISLSVDQDDLYIGTSKGLQWLDNKLALHSAPVLKDNYINALFIDDWGMVWVASEGGIARWNQVTNEIEWLTSKHNIDLVRTSSMIVDQENHLWLSSNRFGLAQIKESKVSNISTPIISSGRINIIHESWNGNLYIGTDKNSIDVYNGERYTSLSIKTNLTGNGVRDIYHDRDGSLWLATYVGIIHIKDGVEKVFSTITGMPADNFRTILKDKKGNFWFGTRSGGLVKFNGGEIVNVYSNGNGLESNFIFSVAEAKNGDIYVGTFSGGLTIIDQEGETQTYHLKEDDSGLLLFNIDFDSLQNALVTANTALLYFDGTSLKEVKLQSDQRSNTLFDVIIDDYEHLWLTSNLGVLQIKKSELKKFQNNEMDEIPYFTIDKSSGMNIENCTGATRSKKISNGNIYIPTLDGIVVIDPRKFERDNFKPQVKIRQMVVDEKEVNIHQDFVICKAGTSRYRFDFSVLSYSSPDRNKFRYKLEGYDNDWSTIGYVGNVEYTNLSPGDYTFKVIGTNDSQLWNNAGDSVVFTVLPFFYETFWFYVLTFIIFVTSILIFFRWRVSFINAQNIKLRKVNTELDRFVYSASHEMRSPLSSILGLINVAEMDEKSDKLEYLDYIKRSVQRLDSVIRDIIDYSKNARLGLEVDSIDLNKQVQEVINDISFTENFSKIKNSVKSNLESPFYSDAKRLKIVLSNLITNAFKHHAPDQVSDPFVNIEIQIMEHVVKIIVSDNGPGIDEEHQGQIFNMFYRATHRSQGSGLGLYIVQEIISNLKGSIKIQSKVGTGTTFIIELPDLRNETS